MTTAPIVSKVWSFCNTLRDDGVGYGDYLEQLTYLIFLKMADEYSKPPYSRKIDIPAKYTWSSLKAKRGAELEAHYIELLRQLGTRKDVLGQIFTKAQNKIQDPAKLLRLIDMIDEVQWVTHGRGRQGRYLRRTARKECGGHEIRRRPILHPSRADPCNGRMCTAGTGQDDC